MHFKYFFTVHIFIVFVLSFVSCKRNIVLFLTDDQDEVLGGMIPMSRTQQLIAKQGATFVNSFTATPVCCPSRASLLTGRYPHNTRTTNNTIPGGCSSRQWQETMEPDTFAAMLSKEGYQTFYAGKYLNMYGHPRSGGPKHVPVGWSTWRGLVGNSVYYNFTLSHDGEPVDYHNEEYLTDVIKDLSLEFLSGVKSESPFLMVLSPPAPHSPYTPAPRHRGTYNATKAPRTPNFNVPATKDKHWLMTMYDSPLKATTLRLLDEVYRSRWEALLAVDEMVEAVVKKITAMGVADDTFFILTSDNGYHIGQFAQPIDKRLPYETDIRVPLVVRGPGIKPGEVVLNPAMNIDLAPTILKMAGVEPLEDMDGVPLSVLASVDNVETNEIKDDEYEREMLIEYSGEASNETFNCPFEDQDLFQCLPKFECRCQDSRNNTYSCVRHIHPTIDFVYCTFNDSLHTVEAYNVGQDPYQMVNTVTHMMPAIKFKYQNSLDHLTVCRGRQCSEFND